MAEGGEGDEDYYDTQGGYGGVKKGNILPFWGNQATMNLNPLILTNVQNSPYYKTTLVSIKVKPNLKPHTKYSRKSRGYC